MKKKKILIPLADHKRLTEAHKKLIEYGKSLGDVTVSVTLGLVEWNKWLRDGVFGYDPAVGTIKKKKKNLCVQEGQLRGIQDLGIEDIKIVTPGYVSEGKRKEVLKVAEKFIAMYDSQLIVERYKLLALSGLMRRWTEEDSILGSVGMDYVLRGPELQAFFFRHIGRLFGWKEIIIMPEMVRDSLTGIRSQYTLSKIPMESLESVMGFRRIFLDAIPYMTVGPNDDLVRELNQSYTGGVEITDATVWEGGMVEGRLVAMGFTVPTPGGGSAIIEDVEYEKG